MLGSCSASPTIPVYAYGTSPPRSAITERSAYGIVTELAEAGYVVKKDGRRNRYRIQAHLPLRESIGRERTIGEVLGLLVDANARSRVPAT